MREIVSHYECIILDACCVINLYASGQMGIILQTIPCDFAIEKYVHDVEVIDIYRNTSSGTEKIRERIDLGPLISSKILKVVTPQSEEEWSTILDDFSSNVLDNGEAHTGAIAKCRNWCIGTDEKRGTAVFTNGDPPIATVSTLDIVKYWIDIAQPTKPIIQEALRNIKYRARYEPGRKHHLYTWWQSYKVGY